MEDRCDSRAFSLPRLKSTFGPAELSAPSPVRARAVAAAVRLATHGYEASVFGGGASHLPGCTLTQPMSALPIGNQRGPTKHWPLTLTAERQELGSL